MQMCLSYHPYEAQLIILAAKVLAASEEFEKAEALLRRAITVHPKMALLRCELATLLTNKLRRDVVAEYKAVVDASGEDADVRCGMGQILVTLGRDRDAEVEFRRAVKLRPTEIVYKIQLAECLFRQRRYKDSLTIVEEAMRSSAPDSRINDLRERLQAALGAPVSAARPRPKHRVRSNEPIPAGAHVG